MQALSQFDIPNLRSEFDLTGGTLEPAFAGVGVGQTQETTIINNFIMNVPGGGRGADDVEFGFSQVRAAAPERRVR
jgi:hypothetical protein